MHSRSLDVLDTLARVALKIGARDLPAADRDDVVATIRSTCRHASQHGGRKAFVAAAAAELIDLLTMSLRRRFNRGLQVTAGGSSFSPRPRAPMTLTHDLHRAWTRLPAQFRRRPALYGGGARDVDRGRPAGGGWA